MCLIWRYPRLMIGTNFCGAVCDCGVVARFDGQCADWVSRTVQIVDYSTHLRVKSAAGRCPLSIGALYLPEKLNSGSTLTDAMLPKTCSWMFGSPGPVLLVLLTLWTVELSVVGAQTDQTRCPSRCLCFRTTVRCMFLQLDHIPSVPHDTTVL